MVRCARRNVRAVCVRAVRSFFPSLSSLYCSPTRRPEGEAERLAAGAVCCSSPAQPLLLPPAMPPLLAAGSRVLRRRARELLPRLALRHRCAHTAPPSTSPVLPRWLVENQRVARALPIIGKGAYATLAAGFLCTDIPTLRLLLVSGYTGLTAFHALHRNPLRIPLRWSIFLVGVNVTMVARLVAECHVRRIRISWLTCCSSPFSSRAPHSNFVDVSSLVAQLVAE